MLFRGLLAVAALCLGVYAWRTIRSTVDQQKEPVTEPKTLPGVSAPHWETPPRLRWPTL